MKSSRQCSWWLLRKGISPFQKQAPISVWRSEGDIMESILSFLLYVRSDDWCNSGFQACTASTFTCLPIIWILGVFQRGVLALRSRFLAQSALGICLPISHSSAAVISTRPKATQGREGVFPLWFQRESMMMGSHGSKQKMWKNIRKLSVQMQNREDIGNVKASYLILSASGILSSARLHFLHLFKQFQQLETSSQNTGDYERHFSFEPL